MSDQNSYSFNPLQWNFLTTILGWAIPSRFAPTNPDDDNDSSDDIEVPDEDAIKAAAQVKSVTDLTDDEGALSDLADAFDDASENAAFLKAASTKLDAVAKSIKDAGRSKADSGLSTDEWNTHVAAVRATGPETRALRVKIKDMLADTDALEADVITELKAMQTAVEAALLEILDLEPAHGPTNHVKLTEDGAGKRALLGTNPRTGNNNDRAGNATKFTSPTAFLDALEAGRSSPELVAAIEDVTDDTDPDNPVFTDTYVKISLKLKDVLGTDYLDLVSGQTVVGSGSQRSGLKTALSTGDDTTADELLDEGGMGVAPTDLTDGTIEFGFMLVDGVWELSTIHPDVARTDTNQPVNDRPADPELRYDRANDRWLKEDASDGDKWKPYDPETDTFA